MLSDFCISKKTHLKTTKGHSVIAFLSNRIEMTKNQSKNNQL